MRRIRSTQTRAAMHVWLGLALLLATLGAALGERLPIKRFTTAEGLARDNINRILQDSRGFLWFCTSEGLSRFDGYSFVNYGTEQGLPARQVMDILESRNGAYWIATSAGLCRLRLAGPETGGEQPGAGGKFVAYYPDDDPAKRSIRTLYEDAAGIIWCGTENGLYRLDDVNGQWQFTSIPLPKPAGNVTHRHDVSALAGDGQGALWISLGDSLCRRRADGVIEVYAEKEGLPIPHIGSALLSDRDGRIWVATSRGLYLLSKDPRPGRRVVERIYTTKDGLTSDFIYALFQSSDRHIWVGTAKGLDELKAPPAKSGRAISSYTPANNLSDVTVRTMAEDRDGNLWMGTESGGAMKLARNGFTSYGQEDGFGGTRVGAVFAGHGRELCVFAGGDRTYINRFDGGKFTAVPLRLPKGMTYWGWGWYQVMFQDHLGEWWLQTGEGLVRYPKTSRLEQLASLPPKTIYTRRNGLGSNNIFRLYEDARGDVWIGTIDNPSVLSRWERATETLNTYSIADLGHDDAASAFCEDGAGNLWIGFYLGGVLRYKDGRFTPFTQADGLPAGLIRGFHIDRAGRLWIATSNGGLGRVDDPNADRPRFTTYTMADGLSSNQATCVTEDAWGKIYVGTGRGVNRLDPLTGHIKRYTTADGLANNFINVSFADRDGALWFGTLQGLSRLVPQPDPPTSPPPVLVSSLTIAGDTQPLPELGVTDIAVPELTANRNQIQIGFLGLSLAVGDSLRYQYKLEGTGQDWSAPTDQRTVNFASLAPGAYRFLVRAVSADGTLSPAPASVVFKILPPIWQRWWFITLAVAMVGSGVFAFDRYRVARLKELDAALTESRKLTEQLTRQGAELRHANRSLALEAAVTGIVSDSATLTEAAPKILQAVCELAEWEAGELWELEPQTQALRCVARWQARTDDAAAAAPLPRDPAAAPVRVRASGDLVPVAGPGDDNGTPAVPREAPRQAFGFPVLLGHEILGVLKLFTHGKREQDTELVEMMSTIGSHIGQLIDRKRAEEALRKSREERLAELERVRRRIATDLHDDIGSSLTQITILSEVAHRQVDQNDKQGLEPLARIITVSNELVDAMSDIVWAINPRKDHLSDLLQRMRRFASDIFTARGISFRFHAPQAETDIELGANLRREVFLVFKESVNNTVKHSACAHAEIDFGVDADWLTLSVSDDGRGFDQALAVDGSRPARRGGNGVLSMQKRAEEMGGEFKIISGAGRGTTVTFRVPIGR